VGRGGDIAMGDRDPQGRNAHCGCTPSDSTGMVLESLNPENDGMLAANRGCGLAVGIDALGNAARMVCIVKTDILAASWFYKKRLLKSKISHRPICSSSGWAGGGNQGHNTLACFCF
jgi:hypothetical protein